MLTSDDHYLGSLTHDNTTLLTDPLTDILPKFILSESLMPPSSDLSIHRSTLTDSNMPLYIYLMLSGDLCKFL